MRMAQSGQLRGRVSEQQLIDLLDQVCNLSRVSAYSVLDVMYLDGGCTVQDNYEDHDSSEYSTTSLT